MYDVNREEIEKTLGFLELLIPTLLKIKEMNREQWKKDLVFRLAAERGVQVTIEALADVGNLLIDGFIMRDPSSYVDIIDILEDEKVIGKELAGDYKHWVSFRRSLVQQYKEVDERELFELIQGYAGQLQQFGPCVREYLDRELF